jgi:peptidylprolyl isomerase
MKKYVSLLAIPALLLAACGGDADSETTTTAEPQATSTTAAQSETTDSGDTAGEGLVAQDGDSVSVHYVGTLDDGSEFDSSRGREPLAFVVGSGQMIDGFDAAVHGMAVGETKSVRIPAGEAYGEVDPELIFSVPIDQAPEDVAVGDEVVIGGVTPGVVTEVTDTEVTIDMNSPFAGEALTFEIEMVSIDRP